MNLKQLLRLASRPAGSIAVITIASGLAVLALEWLGYDFSLLSTAYIGDLEDTLANSWQLQQAMDNLLQRPNDLGYSPAFYPAPDSFAYMVAPYGIAFVALPVYLISGHNIILTYNVYLVATFALTAWTTYLLVQYLLDAPWAVSAVVGLMVAFAQFRFLHLMHIDVLSTQFYLLTLYFLHRLISTPLLRWSVGLALGFWLSSIAIGYLGVMSIVTSAIILGYVVVWKPQLLTKRFVGHLAIACVIGLILVWPFLAFRLNNSIFLAGQPYEEFLLYSTTPADWFSGTSLIYRDITPFRGEGSVFLGLVPISLAITAWRYRKNAEAHWPVTERRAFTASDLVLAYGIVIVVGYVLTLGPVLRIGDRPVAPMPALLLIQLPGFSGMRAMARFILLPMVGTAVLGGYALTLLSKRATKLTFWAVILLVVGLLTIELTPNKPGGRIFGALTSSSDEGLLRPVVLETDGPVFSWLAQELPGTAVMHYPVEGYASYLHWFHQRLHGQPMLNGTGTAYSPRWYRTAKWDKFPSPPTIDLLRERSIGYILVHHELLSDAENAALERRWAEFQAAWGLIPCVGRFGGVNVFEAETVPNQALNQPMTLEFNQPMPGEGLAEPEIWRGPDIQDASFQWTSSKIATLDLPLDEITRAAGHEISIQFRVIAAMTPDILESVALSVNGEQLALKSWTDDEGARIFRGTMSRSQLASNPGTTSLAIQVDRIVSAQTLGKSNDSRLLGVAMDWLRIGPNLSLGCESYTSEG